jgi:hypothetical protein
MSLSESLLPRGISATSSFSLVILFGIHIGHIRHDPKLHPATNSHLAGALDADLGFSRINGPAFGFVFSTASFRHLHPVT